jgi:hypothetical protein
VAGRAITAVLLLLFLGAACDGDGGANGDPGAERGSALAAAPLRTGEAPEGLEIDPRATGPIASLRQILPPRKRFPNVPPLPDRLREAFRDGFERGFAASGGGSSVTSSAVRFADPGSAAAFLAYLHLLPVGGNAAEAEDVPADGLGEEGYGWHLEVPGSESAGFGWRAGDLVLTVTLSGPIGEAGPDAALEVAQRVDDRLG